jgi:hypothetical protein
MKEEVKIINLDECVTNALGLFIHSPPPKLILNKFKKPLVIGSGNAAVTGRILFSNKEAIFANESNYLKKLKNTKRIDGCVIISSSGEKHAPIIAKKIKTKKIKTVLLTNNTKAPANKYTTKTIVFPKNTEPYTYNTSTYLAMILAKTQENPRKIKEHINKLKKPINLKKYTSFFIIVPEELEEAKEMFQTKFDELFGPEIQGRVFTFEQAKHAKTITPSNSELFISFGKPNKTFGKHRLNIPLPKNPNYGALIAVGYYTIGQIQKQHKPYFKKNIEKYTKQASKLFNHKISVIVE